MALTKRLGDHTSFASLLQNVLFFTDDWSCKMQENFLNHMQTHDCLNGSSTQHPIDCFPNENENTLSGTSIEVLQFFSIFRGNR